MSAAKRVESTYLLEGHPGSRDPRPMPADRAAAFTSVCIETCSDICLSLESPKCSIAYVPDQVFHEYGKLNWCIFCGSSGHLGLRGRTTHIELRTLFAKRNPCVFTLLQGLRCGRASS